MTKNKLISEEIKRLEKVISGLDPKVYAIVHGLVEEFAFTKITLKELKGLIDEEGATDEYKNGENQFGKKVGANLQAYNNLLKNYISLAEKIVKHLPSGVSANALMEDIISGK